MSDLDDRYPYDGASDAGTTQAPALHRSGRLWLDTWRVLGVVAAVIGTSFRWWIVHQPVGALDADSAITGLMAREFLNGRWTTYYWGQNYGGSLEAIFTAVVFRVLGSGPMALVLSSVALNAVAALLVWRIGLRIAGRAFAVTSGSLFWVSPGLVAIMSTKSNGFYHAALVCGLVTVLAAFRITETPTQRREWILLGLAFGLGWWQSIQVMLIVAPAFVWLAERLLRMQVPRQVLLRGAAWFGGMVCVGAAPWIAHGFRHGFAALGSQGPEGDGLNYVAHLRAVIRRGVPTALGLRRTTETPWPDGFARPALLTLFLAMMVTGAWWLYRRSPGGSLVLAAVVLVPVMHALGSNASYIGLGRYYYFWLPWIAWLLAASLFRTPVLATFGVAFLTVVTGAALVTAGPVSLILVGAPLPHHLAPLAEIIEKAGDPPVWADYWIAYRLRFETDERVLVASTTYSRDHSAEAKVSASVTAAWAFAVGDTNEGRVVCTMLRRGPVRRFVAGGWALDVQSGTNLKASELDPTCPAVGLWNGDELGPLD